MSSGQSEMIKSLQAALIEWPPEASTHFLPISAIDSYVQHHHILKELQRVFPTGQALEQKCKEICDSTRSARKLFAIYFYEYVLAESENQILEIIDEGIRDKDLPFKRIYDQMNKPSFTLGKNKHSECKLQDHSGCGIRALRDWSMAQIQALCRKQLTVLAPVFELGLDHSIQHYTLEPGCVLPFIYDGSFSTRKQKRKVIEGGYSKVWKVKIHSAHQKFFDAQGKEEPAFAVKQLNHYEEESFLLEREMLVALTTKEHPHLIKLLATWEMNYQYHMLFPYAKHNLRSFWDSTSVEYRNPKTWSWAIAQIRGLASALGEIHFFKIPTVSEHKHAAVSHTTRANIPISVVHAEKPYGRHGDLKPENVLLLDDSNSEASDDIGVLQIADFGLSRFHRNETKSRVDPKHILSSQTYQPPELYLQTHVSRAYDIWSLGCVCLEFISWMVEGSTGVSNFTDARMEMSLLHPQLSDDMFYTELKENHKKVAIVRKGVLNWIQHLHDSPFCSPMIQELLELVKSKMLLIDTSERIKIEKLVEFLTRIQKKAESNPAYLFKE